MSNLTSRQAHEMANNFLALAQAVGDYRYQNFTNLTPAENQALKDLHWSVLNYSDDLYTLSATLVMDDVESSLDTLNQVTENIQADYKHLKNVQKAIDVATSVVVLGASVLSKNPQAIANALADLVETWNTDPEE